MKHILANTTDDGLVFHETACVVDGCEFRSTVSDATRAHERVAASRHTLRPRTDWRYVVYSRATTSEVSPRFEADFRSVY